MTADVKCTDEQRNQTFCDTHIAYRLALIHSTCSSNLQSDCRFEPLRHTEKHQFFWNWETLRYLCRIFNFNRQNL